MKACLQCEGAFEPKDEHRAFYAKIGVPEPTLCPSCRLQRRLAWRNERMLYNRKCDMCAKSMVSIFPAGTPFPVYCFQDWWSDRWDPRQYGRAYDPARPFMEQWKDLLYSVPMPSLLQSNCVNSEYAHSAGNNKNCYLIFCSSFNEDSYYTYWLQQSKDCVDCMHCFECEQCYECIDCTKCYAVQYSQNSSDCSNSAFLYDCRNCSDSFMCVNQRNASFKILNQQYTEEEYKQRMKKIHQGSWEEKQKLWKQFEELKLQYPHVYQIRKNSEHVTGDYFLNSTECLDSYTAKFTENVAYCHDSLRLKDSMDSMFGNPAEWLYETNNIGFGSSYVSFSSYGYGLNFSEYCYHCHHSSELFGCVGLHQQNTFCILNMQYSEEDYKKLKAQIIQDMQKRGEYGEFPSAGMALSSYNETSAQEYFPLLQTEVEQRGWKWSNQLPGTFGKETINATDVPDNISIVTSEILKQILACASCQKNYRIIKPELDFYTRHNIPLPRQCFDCRHLSRLSLRNPRSIQQRACGCEGARSAHAQYTNSAQHSHGSVTCPTHFETTYTPQRKEIVYCEACYQAEVI